MRSNAKNIKTSFIFHLFAVQQVVTSIGMLHIGVVFIVFGVFLLGAGLIPDDISAANAWSIFGN